MALRQNASQLFEDLDNNIVDMLELLMHNNMH
jgi:hypothetical protein